MRQAENQMFIVFNGLTTVIWASAAWCKGLPTVSAVRGREKSNYQVLNVCPRLWRWRHTDLCLVFHLSEKHFKYERNPYSQLQNTLYNTCKHNLLLLMFILSRKKICIISISSWLLTPSKKVTQLKKKMSRLLQHKTDLTNFLRVLHSCMDWQPCRNIRGPSCTCTDI